MNWFQIEVRGVTFTVWAPSLREAVETFMIDMDILEVPSELATYHSHEHKPLFPPECGGF